MMKFVGSLSINQFRDKAISIKHKISLWRLGLGRGKRYQAYLRLQFERTLSRQDSVLRLRTKLLIDRIFELGKPVQTSSVLCIGCRNTIEIDYFKYKNLLNVVGIDLISENPDILVMDMHNMTFPDNQFDIIYSSHSLEHAYDVGRVVNEIVRVSRPGGLIAIEVPIKYQTRGADLIDFEDCEKLHSVFQPHISRIFWSDEQAPHSLENESGTAVIRSIFSIKKNSE